MQFFQRPQIALAQRARAILLVLKKFTPAYLFQIVLEIMWLPILREYLFKINSCVSLICECSFDSESVKHFFLYFPKYAAQREVLLTSTANILGETWSSGGDAGKLNFLLYGDESVNYDVSCAFFREVQSFIINTNRFSEAIVWLYN